MLITFETKAYANITMFGDVATKLLKFMGHSATVPGAILAEDIPEALEKLRSCVQTEMQVEQNHVLELNQDEKQNYVSIDKRAMPLIELLEAAAKQKVDVTWDK